MSRVVRALCCALFLLGGAFSSRADALANDIVLSKLPPNDPLDQGSSCCAVSSQPWAQEAFARFASEIGLATIPLPTPPTSLGQSGFELSLSEDISYIHPNQKFGVDNQTHLVWPTEQQAPNELYLTGFRVRKGLPLSLELEAGLSYIGRSSMVAPYGGIKWTFVEGIPWVPDLAMHAFCSVLLGAPSLTLVTFGWDVSAGYKIPIYGTASLAFYVGYQVVGVDATTMNIDFNSQHFDNSCPSCTDDVYQPLNYGNIIWPTTRFNRMYFGAELKWNIAVVGIDAADSWGTNAIDSSVGASTFNTQLWKVGFRGGVRF